MTARPPDNDDQAPFDSLADRRAMSFAQAEREAAVPSQLEREDMPRVLRAKLWGVLHSDIVSTWQLVRTGGRVLGGPWRNILRDEAIDRRGRFPENFYYIIDSVIEDLSGIFSRGNYVEIYDFLQYLIRHPMCPPAFSVKINNVLLSERASFRIVEQDTFMPIGSEEEASAIVTALVSTSTSQFQGAHSHLRQAATTLTAGQFADSVRESIHAVEAVARTLEPSAELSRALGRLERSTNLHSAMKKAFTALYGYSSDEQGIRHPLLDSGDATVDEADAVFMIGACASFVTYLIAKKRSAGLGVE